MKHQQALGLIETRGLTAAIEAADAALKTAAVELVGYERVTGGLVMIAVTGEVAAVQAAVSAGAAAASKVGDLISQHVIPRPLADVELLVKRHRGGKDSNPTPPAPQTPDKKVLEAAKPETKDISPALKPVKDSGSDAKQDEAPLESMSVHELRKLARKTPGIAIQGREISRANKEQLIVELIRARKGG